MEDEKKLLTGNCLDVKPSAQEGYSRVDLGAPSGTYEVAGAAEWGREVASLRSGQQQLLSLAAELKSELAQTRRELSHVRSVLESCDGCQGPPPPPPARHPCDANPCFPGVICADNGEDFICGACPPGYVGDGIRCQAHPTCNDRPCFAGVRCSDTEGGFRCGACPPGYTGNGIQCQQLRSPCQPSPCYPGVDCRDHPAAPGGFHCGPCPAGLEGDGQRCEQRRSYCERRPCYPGVECREQPAQPFFSCGPCPLGFHGNGSHCDDLNECAEANPCAAGTECNNYAPGFACGPCPRGYEGRRVEGVGLEFARNNRQVCRDINECDVRNGGCGSHVHCVNVAGSYRCRGL